MQKTVREWEDHGFRCLITAPDFGRLRGYVGVAEGHPLSGMGVELVKEQVWVRPQAAESAVNFAGELPADSYAESYGLWWIGFDALDSDAAESLEQTVNDCNWLQQELAGIAIVSEIENGEPELGPETLCTLCGGPSDGTEVLIEDYVDATLVPFDSPAGYEIWSSYIRSDDDFTLFLYGETRRPSPEFFSDLPPS